MRKTSFFILLAIVTFTAAIGCSGDVEKPKKPKSAKKKAPPPTAVVITASLKELLDKPRAELARQCDELTAEIRTKEKFRAEDSVTFALNGNIRLALSVPVFQVASYAKDTGFSLPPYLTEGTHDNGLALHLARHGDVEAALQIVDPADKSAAAAVAALKAKRNYPLEWTRLVGLMMHSAQFSLANGNVDGAKDLLKLHHQLADLTTDDTFPASLRTALAPRGKTILKLAAEAWRKGQNPELAAEINSALLKWETVRPSVLCPPGSTRETVTALFGAECIGLAVTAKDPMRVVDLLCLPLPSQGLEAATACFNGFDRLEEILITYEAMAPDIESATQFGQALDDWCTPYADTKIPSRCVYPMGDSACELVVVSRNSAVAAVARLARNQDRPDGIVLPREFGPIHLSGTFERNRRSAALHERANRLVLARANDLEPIKNPLPVLPLDHVVLARHTTEDVIDELVFEYARPADAPRTLARIAQPLFELFGAPQLRASGKDMLVEWEDQNTRFVLTIPDLSTRPIRLIGADVHVPIVRHQLARAWDLAERKQRIETGQPLTLLPREFEGIALGMDRKQVAEAMSTVKDVRHTAFDRGDKYLFANQEATTSVSPREVFVHYDTADTVNALRARYELSPETSPDYILGPIQAKAGAAQPLPGKLPVWPELTPLPAPTLQQWRDDITVLTCRRADSALDLSVRDCPLAQPDGLPLPELVYLPRGTDGCLIGTAKAELFKTFGVTEPVVSGGAVVLGTQPTSPFDTMLVWFSDDKVSRIVARHRGDTVLRDSTKAGLAMRQEWARKLTEFGWPWRHDFAGNIEQSWGHHDDRTRVRIFWQDTTQGKQIFTEWMPLPTNAPPPVAKTAEKRPTVRKKR